MGQGAVTEITDHVSHGETRLIGDGRLVEITAAGLHTAQRVLLGEARHDRHHRRVGQGRAAALVQAIEDGTDAERLGSRPERLHDLALEGAEEAGALTRHTQQSTTRASYSA